MNDNTFSFLEKGNQKANIESLESGVKTLIHMATQMTAGQTRGDNKGDIPFEILDIVKWQIICEAVALVLDGRWDKAREIFKDDGED